MEINLKYIKELKEYKLKKLIYYSFLECDKKENTHYLTNRNFEDIKIAYQNFADDGYIYLSSLSYNDKDFCKYQYNDLIYNSNFKINDFEMIIYDGKWYKDLSNILHMYLSAVFLTDYPEDLYKKRVEDAINERRFILDNSLEYLDNLLKTNRKRTLKK